jgi:type III restriction enzyme
MSSGIDHLIINKPYEEPGRFWQYDALSMSFKLATGRRPAGYMVASSNKKIINDPGTFIPLPLVNQIRKRVKEWREGNAAEAIAPYAGVTGITRRLLEHWNNSEEREGHRFFFCQLEAIETLIWFAEAPAALKVGIDIPGDGGEFRRLCSKMATGTGKTIVMSKLIAWHALNKITYPQDTRFAKNFLVVAPGLTVRNRLSVLVPAGEGNYYDEFNIVPLGLREKLRQAKVIVRNWHALAWETEEKVKRRKSVDKRGAKSDEAYTREVLAEMESARNFVVINDEAHHAWRVPAGLRLRGEEKKEAEEATIWIGGLDRLHKARGILTAYDFSATPFTPTGKAAEEENLFGWIVSDFNLNDAIEAGLVKTPRVVVRDDGKLTSDYKSQFYHLYSVPDVKTSLNQRNALPTAPLPQLVHVAYTLLGMDWLETLKSWRSAGQFIPPVMITVANRTETAARVKYHFDSGRVAIPELSNPDRTLHIDSKVLEMAEAQAEEAAAQSSDTTPDASGDDDEAELSEPTRKLSKKEQAQRLRDMVDSIGKPGGLGQNTQHVISVAMLSEGWDAKNVTHIMGLRAFSSQLLCEQVVGRGLRRTSYDIENDGYFKAEYVNIFGVPFTFMPYESADDGKSPKIPAHKTRVEPIAEREEMAISFPNVVRVEYTYRPALSLDLNSVEPLTLSAYETPRFAQLAPILDGKHDFSKIKEIDLERLQKEVRLQTSIFDEALSISANMRSSWKGSPVQLFTQLVPLVERFIGSSRLDFSPPLFATDDIKRRILVRLNAEKIVNHLSRHIQSENTEELKLVVDQDHPIKSTADMKAWDTSKACVHTQKSHINFCVCDSTWEANEAMNLDRSNNVKTWVKNDHLGFEISYIYNGAEHKYRPDFLIRLATNEMLVLETKGQEIEQDKTKRSALREWIRAVNAHGGFGRWHPEPAISKHPDDIPEILAKTTTKPG